MYSGAVDSFVEYLAAVEYGDRHFVAAARKFVREQR
jgi:hypothetical protein